MSELYPIRFEPVYRDYIWGGEKIGRKYERTHNLDRMAESWEISDRTDGMSVALNGFWKGKSLQEIHKKMGEELMGKGRDFSSFPLLIKLIDARENLSIQVHPNETTAPSLQGEAKSELWYVLHSDPGAVVYAGLKPGIYEEKFTDEIRSPNFPDMLEQIEVHPHDVIYVPGGCVHAVGAGCLLLEVQQNSDTTYRIYDWDRKHTTGKKRDLHHKEALAAIDWKAAQAKAVPHKISSDLHHTLWMALSAPHFVVQRVEVYDTWHIPHHFDTFQIFFCMEGEGEISVGGKGEKIQAGMTYLLPAACRSGEIKGRCDVLWITLEGHRL